MYERILFVCTGNTCRSPIAEGLLRLMARREGLRLQVRSAGVSAFGGSPISPHSRDILREKGFRDPIVSSELDGETAAWADLILTMTMAHKQAIVRRFPEAVDKVHTLKEFASGDAAGEASAAERMRLYTELQIKQALGEPVTAEEREAVERLEREAPDPDISDPFGGDRRTYELTAREIEASLEQLLRRLKTDR